MVIRELTSDDENYWKDAQTLLSQLSPTNLNIVNFTEFMIVRRDYGIITWGAFIDTPWPDRRARLIGTVSLATEPKLSHNGRMMGTLTDLVVSSEYGGEGIAKKLVDKCIQWCKDHDYYKLILTCKPALRGYYERSGFREVGIEMRLDLGA